MYMKYRFLLLHILLLVSFGASAQLTVVINSYPEDTPFADDIYIAGNFNAWNPGNPDYILDPQPDGTRLLTFSPAAGTLAFKFTRGDWGTVEGNEFGGFLPDRNYTYAGGIDTVYFDILTWEDTGGPTSTAAWNVNIMSESFYMPQLDANRRIWIYLPPDYATSIKNYKVLYMHDGQNVFDQSTSFAGEWKVDETLNDLFDEGDEGCIVVAIDNGGVDRLEEYSPWAMPDYGVTGHGEDYMAFIVSTLKPYVDANYRTRADRASTGLMGSSMGGLISHYGGITYNEVFSRIGIFSPSYWVSDSCFQITTATPHDATMRIYTIAGNLEGGSMVGNVMAMEDTYAAAGYDATEHQANIFADGQHSEWFWAREFEAAYEWLWQETPVGITTDNAAATGLKVFPNPANGTFYLQDIHSHDIQSISIYDMTGSRIVQLAGYQESITLDLPMQQIMLVVEYEHHERVALPVMLNGSYSMGR